MKRYYDKKLFDEKMSGLEQKHKKAKSEYMSTWCGGELVMEYEIMMSPLYCIQDISNQDENGFYFDDDKFLKDLKHREEEYQSLTTKQKHLMFFSISSMNWIVENSKTHFDYSI